MDAIEKSLKQLLDKMDVPEMRKEPTAHNLRWLQRNLFIRNKDKDEFPSAIHLIATLLVMQGENPSLNKGDIWVFRNDEWIEKQRGS